MTIVISGVNNNDKITALDGTIDLLSGSNLSGNLTAPSINVGVATAITFVGNLTGNVTGNVNATSNLLLQIGGSEKFRVGSSGQLGIGGANYGSSGQVLTSGGSGSAATWSTLSGTTINTNADNRIITGSGTPNTLNGEANLTYNGTKLTLTGNSASPVVEFINTSGASGEGDVLKLRASGRGSGIDDTDIFLITNNSDTRTFGISNAGTVNVTGDIKMSSGKNINSSGIITATSFSGSGENLTGLSTPLSFRNVVINGGMQIAQRGTNSTGNTSGGFKTCDRWELSLTSAGTWTVAQSTNCPDGFNNSIKLDCTTANTSLSATSFLSIRTAFEGQDLQRFAKGKSGAKAITVSFYVKTNKNGTYAVELYDVDNTKIATSLYTVSNNNWNRYEFTIPASTNTGEFANDNNKSMSLGFIVAAGTNFTNGTQYGFFVQGSNLNRAAGLTVNLADSTSNEFYLTGVQMEVGETATPFEHRNISDELTRCQRYYQLYGAQRHTWYTNVNGTDHRKMVYFPNTMRTSPTMNLYSQSVDGSSVSAQYITPDGYSCRLNGNGRMASWKHEAEAEL